MTRSEIWRLEKYLRNLFQLDTISVIERPRQTDSVEVHVGGEFIGVIFKDEEEGETSYAFQMAILEMDLPPAPASRCSSASAPGRGPLAKAPRRQGFRPSTSTTRRIPPRRSRWCGGMRARWT